MSGLGLFYGPALRSVEGAPRTKRPRQDNRIPEDASLIDRLIQRGTSLFDN
jgi:hypothetical protein